ncbi:MAG: DUF58 domain-containing protein [Burkholderiaceae bacterium]|nr:DUF58 domain-containing protein [Burkholderiaceae bacterium]
MSTLPLNPFTWASARVQTRFRSWWHARLPRTDTQLLTHRNVFILPTRAGCLFASTLLVLLVASINYQLNLGYALTFVLAGSGLVSMQLTHDTLRGLTLHLRPVGPVHAGEAALLDVVLTSPDAARWGVGLRVHAASAATLSWTDVPAGGQATAQVSFAPKQRGRHDIPALTVESRFPLGLFRAWTVWRPAAQVLVYPRLESPSAPLPPTSAASDGPMASRHSSGTEFEGIRAYRRGDPLKMVVWKKAASAMETEGKLVSRDSSASAHQQLWLDWQSCGDLSAEERLSRLAAWVLAVDRSGADYGLRIPGVELTRGQGEAQRRASLEALALWT